jgi:type VI secretion system protein ImpL
MLAFFKKRAFLVALGLIFLSLFIWFAGPYFAFADFHPWAPVWARVLTILLVIAIWGGVALFKRVKAALASAKLAAAVAKPAAQGVGADAQQLRERFEEAIAALKQNQKPGHTIYELPWYAIIGAPGSGKTTALVNSGLNFPLAQRFGKEALRGVGGTRNCDWWFTDEAVLLDTAGRYTTQDSDQSADSAGWSEFLTLLRKHRKRRPLNGVIVAVSALDLMTHSAPEREQHIAAVRRRLDELNRELKVNLPVYTIVTKCDLIAGFSEYFDDLAQEGRAQVWGVTFPYEQTTNGQAAVAFPAEFDALIERLNGRMFTRLHEERDARRRAAIFAFPQQLAGVRESLSRFVHDVFGGSRYDGRVMLRGVYFTSGTQEGTPIDRLMGAISRSFALGHDAVSAAPSGRGKAYFIERLLKDVMFAESGLAGVNRKMELQKAALQMAAYAAMVLTAVIGVILLSVSYSRNKSYVTEVMAEAGALTKLTAGDLNAPLEAVVPRLDTVRGVVDIAKQHQSDVPWSMRWGLYQGRAVSNTASDAYVRELDSALLPRVAGALKQRLYANIADPDRLYEYLKAYLMLGQPEHLDKAQLGFLVDLEWQSRYSEQPEIRDALSSHFHGLLENADQLRQMPIDQELVSRAREAIKLANVPRLMYSRLKLKYAGDTQRAVRLDVSAGLGAERVLARKSGRSLSEPVSALYTPAIFKEVTTLGAATLVKEFAADSWVLGDEEFDVQNSARMAYQVMDVYEQDYIRAWDEVLADVQLAQFRSLSQTAEALNILAAPTSPLRGLLITVDTNTQLIKPPDPNQGSVAKAGQAAEAQLGRLFGAAREASGAPSTQPGAKVTAHFDSLHKLVQGPPGQAPIDRVLSRLGQLGQQLQSVGGGVGETDPLQALTRAGQGDALRALQQDAAMLPPAIGAMVAQIGGRSQAIAVGQARNELDNRYQVQVVKECTAIVSGRYPFNARGATDVPLADFGRLFAAGGIFDNFFKEHLIALVDTSRNPWRWRQDASGAIGASQSMLRQFETAQRIRDMYFRPGGSTPEVRFNITPNFLDANASRVTLQIDGQNFDYRHGPERTWTAVWPGPSPGAAAVQFENRNGTRPNQAFDGPWALFRLLDTASLQSQSDVRYLATLRAEAHEARVLIEAASIRNPFMKPELRQFRCGG